MGRFYFFINVGSIIAFTAVVYVQQEVGFTPGYIIPAVGMVLALVLFVSLKRACTHRSPAGEPCARPYFLGQIVNAWFNQQHFVHVECIFEAQAKACATRNKKRVNPAQTLQMLGTCAAQKISIVPFPGSVLTNVCLIVWEALRRRHHGLHRPDNMLDQAKVHNAKARHSLHWITIRSRL